MSNLFANYFDSNIFRLKLAAFWVHEKGTSTRIKYAQMVYNIFWSIFLYLLYFSTEFLAITIPSNSFTDIIRILRDLGNHIGLILKAVNWFRRREQILQLLRVLQHIHFDYENYRNFQPELIVLEHKAIAKRWSDILFHLINTICFCMFVSGLYIFIFYGEDNYVWENGKYIYQQKLPVNVISPFGDENRNQFLITFIYVLVSLTFYGWMISGLDSLFISILSCVSAHLRIIEGAVKTIRSRCCLRVGMDPDDKMHDSFMLQREMQEELRKCIIHLQIVYRTSQEIEDIYSIQTLSQTFISLYEICFCLYLLSISPYDSIGSELTYLFSTGFQLLLYCWFGDMVTESGQSVSYALFDCEWLSSNISFRKQIIFTMIRMTKPIHVTIGKITPLSFMTFLSIARGAYSYFTFLRRKNSLALQKG